MGRNQVVKSSSGRRSWDKDSVGGDKRAFLLSWNWEPTLFRNTESGPTGTLHKPAQEVPGRAEMAASLRCQPLLQESGGCRVWLFGPILSLEMPSECSCADWPVQSLCPTASRGYLSPHSAKCDADCHTQDVLLVESPRSN